MLRWRNLSSSVEQGDFRKTHGGHPSVLTYISNEGEYGNGEPTKDKLADDEASRSIAAALSPWFIYSLSPFVIVFLKTEKVDRAHEL